MVRFINIGLDNYAASVKTLKGCENDARKWYSLLVDNNFTPFIEPILNEFAKTDAILNYLERFVLNLSDDDIGVITYSGHGTLIERNGNLFDEAIYGYEGKIKAQELEGILKLLKPNAKLIFFIDACYSENIIGTGYIEKMRVFFKSIFFGKKSLHKNFIDVKENIRFHYDNELQKSNQHKTRFIDKVKDSNKHKIFLYTSCKENQKSYEREFDNGETEGVFSHYVQKILIENNYQNFSYESFSLKIKEEMSSELKQTPDEKLVMSLKDRTLFS